MLQPPVFSPAFQVIVDKDITFAVDIDSKEIFIGMRRI